MANMVELLPDMFINVDQIQTIEIEKIPATRKNPQGKRISVYFANPSRAFAIFIADVIPTNRTDEEKQKGREIVAAAELLSVIARGGWK